MKRPALSLCVASCALLGIASGCGDDSARADGEGEGGTDTDTSGASEEGDDGDDAPLACAAAADCDDANPCTKDACEAGTCTFTAVVSNECRPHIDVEFPPRGATIMGDRDDPTIEVIGKVTSKAAPIASLTINGESVDVSPDGDFSHSMPANVGGNMLVLETFDGLDVPRKRVQSFLWATDYLDPTEVPVGMVTEGLGVYLDQEAVDDGDRSMPADDLATILNVALDTFDLSAFIDPNTPLTHSAGYDVYLTGLDLGSTMVTVEVLDGGLYMSAGLQDILGDLEFDCTTAGCILAGGDSTGGLSIDYLGITGNLTLMVGEDHQLSVVLQNVNVELDPNDVEIWSDNWWTDFLITVIEPFIMDGVVADITASLESQVQDVLGPALGSALSGLSFDTTLNMPALVDGGDPIGVRLVTDFQDTDFHDGVAPPQPSPPQGGLIIQRAGGYPVEVKTPHDNLGVPVRDGCGSGAKMLKPPRTAPLEIALSDDLVNELLHAAWRGGILEFPVTQELLGGGGGFISDLEMTASGMLAPTASDCYGQGEILVHIGDLELVASLTFINKPMTFTAYTSMIAKLDVSVAPEGTMSIGIAEVLDVQTELTVGEDENIAAEDAVGEALQKQLIDVLLAKLGKDGAFGTLELPEFDISGQLGLPAGTALIKVHPQSAVRVEGSTVIQGTL